MNASTPLPLRYIIDVLPEHYVISGTVVVRLKIATGLSKEELRIGLSELRYRFAEVMDCPLERINFITPTGHASNTVPEVSGGQEHSL